MLWIFLEINLLLFIPLLFGKKRKYQSESSLKYFINQAISSVLILSAVTFLAPFNYLRLRVLVSAFRLKMGVAPLHGWLIAVSSSISWFRLWLLLIPQKIAPIFIVGSLVDRKVLILLYFYILVTALLGALGGLTTPSIKKIITYSSISQIRWLLVALTLGNNIWIVYFLVYSMITSVIMLTLSFTKTNKINDLLSRKNKIIKIIIIINILSISGLPPFSGFMIKLTLILKASERLRALLLAPLISSSLVSLYFYTRVFYINLVVLSSKKLEENKTTFEKMVISINLVTLPIGLVLLL